MKKSKAIRHSLNSKTSKRFESLCRLLPLSEGGLSGDLLKSCEAINAAVRMSTDEMRSDHMVVTSDRPSLDDSVLQESGVLLTP